MPKNKIIMIRKEVTEIIIYCNGIQLYTFSPESE